MKVDLLDRLIAKRHGCPKVLLELLAQCLDLQLCRLTPCHRLTDAGLDDGGLPNGKLDTADEAEHVPVTSPDAVRRLDVEVRLGRQLRQTNVLLGTSYVGLQLGDGRGRVRKRGLEDALVVMLHFVFQRERRSRSARRKIEKRQQPRDGRAALAP